MDDLKAFSRALSEQEVKINMNKKFMAASCTSEVIQRCGETDEPKRGVCMMDGACLCAQAWSGVNCSERIVKPRLKVSELDVTVDEFSDFVHEIELSEGTQPLFFDLVERVDQVTLHNKTVLWSKVTSDKQTNSISVRGTNSLGTAVLKLRVKITPAYFIELTQLTSTDFLQNQHVLISGQAKSTLTKEILKQGVNFNLIIQSSSFSTKHQLRTTNEGLFFYRQVFGAREFGSYLADAKHPFDTSKASPQIKWNVLGLDVDKSTISFSGFTGEMFTQKIRLSNPNLVPVHRLKLTFETSSHFCVTVNNCKISECILVENISPGKSLDLTISFQANSSLNGRLPLTFTSQENIPITIYLNVNLVEKKIILLASPSQFSFRIKQNERLFLDFELSNNGRISANDLSIRFNNSSLKCEVSSMIKQDELIDPNNFNLLINEVVQVTFSVIIKDLAINNEAYIYVSDYKIPIYYVLCSSTESILTIAVEDEFTYFAGNKPKLSNAVITLSNGFTKQRQTTNATGYATFVNLTENLYDLLVEADRHATKRLVWQPVNKDNYLSVFLERRMVSITFTVIPRLVEDKYDIILESEFETNVPAPVVTVDPMYVDLEELETGLVERLTFNITNHGLIKANDLEIKLPDINVSIKFIRPLMCFKSAFFFN